MATTEAVRERPILFSGEMVRAILEGRKTKTRRVLKIDPQGTDQYWHRVTTEVTAPDEHGRWGLWSSSSREIGTDSVAAMRCPYGQPGDRLWVREAVYIDQMPYDRGALPKDRPGDLDERSIYYRADGECCDQIPECCCAEVGKPRWRPSIHMPRWASRITLELTDVRVERVQEISEEDARAEGLLPGEVMTAADVMEVPPGPERELAQLLKGGHATATFNFAMLWDDLNRKLGYGWSVNPWVWVLSFRVLTPNPPHGGEDGAQ